MDFLDELEERTVDVQTLSEHHELTLSECQCILYYKDRYGNITDRLEHIIEASRAIKEYVIERDMSYKQVDNLAIMSFVPFQRDTSFNVCAVGFNVQGRLDQLYVMLFRFRDANIFFEMLHIEGMPYSFSSITKSTMRNSSVSANVDERDIKLFSSLYPSDGMPPYKKKALFQHGPLFRYLYIGEYRMFRNYDNAHKWCNIVYWNIRKRDKYYIRYIYADSFLELYIRTRLVHRLEFMHIKEHSQLANDTPHHGELKLLLRHHFGHMMVETSAFDDAVEAFYKTCDFAGKSVDCILDEVMTFVNGFDVKTLYEVNTEHDWPADPDKVILNRILATTSSFECATLIRDLKSGD